MHDDLRKGGVTDRVIAVGAAIAFIAMTPDGPAKPSSGLLGRTASTFNPAPHPNCLR